MRAHNKRRLAFVLAGVSVFVIFAVDLMTPLGVADWLGYLLPLLVFSRVARSRQVTVFVAICSVLIVLGFVFSLPGIDPRIAVVNRTLAIGALWLMAGVLTQRQRMEDRLAESNARLQALARRLVDVQEDERRALARELHDETGQALTALAIGLGMLERDSECNPAIAGKLEELKTTTNGIMQELHRLAVRLRPSSLDRLGLAAALQQYASQLAAEQQAAIELEMSDLENVRLSPDIEIALYRIAQESLTNVARYANAGHVGIILTRNGHDLTLVIEDDGVGFDVEEAMQRGRLGLVGMRERAEALGGNLAIETALGSGTSILVQIPLEQTDAVTL